MAYLGFSINTVTLLALSLVIGVLVDDAIVEVETSKRHLNMGKTPYQAAMEATNKLAWRWWPPPSRSLRFLPTAFMAGIPGEFFKQFGWTAALAVFCVIGGGAGVDAHDGRLHHEAQPAPHKDPFWMPAYLRASRWALNHRWITLGLAEAFFIGPIALIPLLPKGFIPPDDTRKPRSTRSRRPVPR